MLHLIIIRSNPVFCLPQHCQIRMVCFGSFLVWCSHIILTFGFSIFWYLHYWQYLSYLNKYASTACALTGAFCIYFLNFSLGSVKPFWWPSLISDQGTKHNVCTWPYKEYSNQVYFQMVLWFSEKTISKTWVCILKFWSTSIKYNCKWSFHDHSCLSYNKIEASCDMDHIGIIIDLDTPSPSWSRSNKNIIK